MASWRRFAQGSDPAARWARRPPAYCARLEIFPFFFFRRVNHCRSSEANCRVFPKVWRNGLTEVCVAQGGYYKYGHNRRFVTVLISPSKAVSTKGSSLVIGSGKENVLLHSVRTGRRDGALSETNRNQWTRGRRPGVVERSAFRSRRLFLFFLMIHESFLRRAHPTKIFRHARAGQTFCPNFY